MYTTLANTLKVADEHIRYDECAKKVIANISVAALILKTCTDEFAEFDAEYIADNCIGHVSIAESAAHQDHGGDWMGMKDWSVSIQSHHRLMKVQCILT